MGGGSMLSRAMAGEGRAGLLQAAAGTEGDRAGGRGGVANHSSPAKQQPASQAGAGGPLTAQRTNLVRIFSSAHSSSMATGSVCTCRHAANEAL